jgi:hypothetical protein
MGTLYYKLGEGEAGLICNFVTSLAMYSINAPRIIVKKSPFRTALPSRHNQKPPTFDSSLSRKSASVSEGGLLARLTARDSSSSSLYSPPSTLASGSCNTRGHKVQSELTPRGLKGTVRNSVADPGGLSRIQGQIDSRIPDPHPHQRILSILTYKIVSKLSNI